MRVPDPIPVPAGVLKGVRRWALTGWRCLRCGTMWEAHERPGNCCEDQWVLRVDVIRSR